LRLQGGARAHPRGEFNRAREIDPTSEPARLALANFYWAAGQFEDAERELKTALEQNPKSPVANRALAVFYGMTNRDELGERYLKIYADLTAEPGPKLVLADYYLMRD